MKLVLILKSLHLNAGAYSRLKQKEVATFTYCTVYTLPKNVYEMILEKIRVDSLRAYTNLGGNLDNYIKVPLAFTIYFKIDRKN